MNEISIDTNADPEHNGGDQHLEITIALGKTGHGPCAEVWRTNWITTTQAISLELSIFSSLPQKIDATIITVCTPML